MNEFNITNNTTYMHIGNNIIKDINKFLTSIGKNKKTDINILTNIISKFINILIKSHNSHFFTFEIRATIPNNSYNISRWHQDGNFNMASKTRFIIPIKGPGTLSLNKNTKALNALKKYGKKNKPMN